MRAAGVSSVLVYCSDYRCSHWTRLGAERCADDVRLSDEDMLRVVVSWIERTGAVTSETRTLTEAALRNAWPCKK